MKPFTFLVCFSCWLLSCCTFHPNAHPAHARLLADSAAQLAQNGDLPTALTCLQDALKELPDEPAHLRQRRDLLSQTADLYGRIVLYDEAVHYYEQAIVCDSLLANDSCLMEDYDDLGALQLNYGTLNEALDHFEQAVQAAARVSQQDSLRMSVRVAGILASSDDPQHSDSALTMLRGLYAQTEGMERNLADIFFALAYFGAHQYDSAYVYARKVVDDPNFDNRQTAYQVLVQPEMRVVVPADSLAEYSIQLHIESMQFLKQHDSQEAMMQNTMYNYRRHEQERDAALRAEHRAAAALAGTLIVVLVLIIVLLYMKNRNAQQIIKLRQALDVIDRLLAAQNGQPSATPLLPPAPSPLTAEALKQQIAERLQGETPRYEVPASLSRTDAYQQLVQNLTLGRGIPEKDPLWPALVTAVEASFPGFRQRLQLLTENNLTDADLQIVVLLKCGVSPTGMATLLNKTKGTISSRRRTLSLKIFGEHMGNAVIDSIMQQL